MGFIFAVLKRIIKIILYIGIVIAIILLLPNLPPYTKFTSIDIDPTQPRTGALAPNGDLNNVEKLYVDKLLGPEAFGIWNAELYTSLATGEIVKISHGGHVTFVTQIGQPCIGIVHEHLCGRPLGFTIDDKNKQMYVADAYYGIWKVDLRSYKKQLLVSPRKEIEGRKPMLFNSVTLAGNGDLYWTDSSSDYHLKDGIFAIISDPSGRLFRYSPSTNESTVLLDNMWFPNGVIISPDNQFVLVVESNQLRVLKYYIDGPKKGLTEVFVSGLPGTPDSIRTLPDGSGVLVSLYAAFDEEHPLLSKSLASTPLARKFLARFMKLLELPFEFLNTHFPHIIFEQIVYVIGHFECVSGLIPGLSGIVQLDWNGNIVASYYNTDNSISHISDAIVFNDKLYLGCPHAQKFIGAVPVPPLLKKAFNVVQPPTTAKVKAASEQQISQKDKKSTVDQTKQKRKLEQPTEQKPRPKTSTDKPVSSKDKIKTETQQKPGVKPNSIPKEPVKASVKEDTKEDATPKVTTSKLKKEVENEPIKQKTTTPPTPSSKTESKKDATPKSKEVPESKPNVAPKVEEKKAAPEPKVKVEEKKAAPEPKVKVEEKKAVREPKVYTEAKPTATPKTEPKKDDPAKFDTEKTKTVVKESKPSSEKPASKSDTSKPLPKPDQVKKEKKVKKSPVINEPQIIVQKVVPDEIPVQEDILSDTSKPKGEPLKVLTKSGPVEIPSHNV